MTISTPRSGRPHATTVALGLTRRPAAGLPLGIWGLVIVGSAIGWLWLAAGIAARLQSTDMATLGPGMGLFNRLNGLAALPEGVRAGLTLLCSPAGVSPWAAAELAAGFGMWEAMILAMMLPTVLPLLRVATARGLGGARGPAALAAGFLAVWTGFALLATLAQAALTAARLLAPGMGPMTAVLAATTLLAAAVYQWTPLKSACLARCRAPVTSGLPMRARPVDLLATGAAEGLASLGCCWALMLVMFAAGVMNVVWVAILGAVMVAERVGSGPWPSRIIGLGLAAVGLVWLAASPVGARLMTFT